MKNLAFAACALVLALAACGPEAQTPAPGPGAPALALQALSGADIEGRLGGELGCSFTANGDVLLVAMGDVNPGAYSEALIRREGEVLLLPALSAGGYDAMVETAAFATGAMSAAVQTGARNQTGDEQVEHSATLTVRADGAERAYDGVWTCGP
ncbi:MAG TPA: hypothetical protein PLS69_06935 [Terricaulis sp.]|nr:hypothetical protein [Terricaulis sp.]HRP11933.1 hypothetical protein [Terricaulis sp.]